MVWFRAHRRKAKQPFFEARSPVRGSKSLRALDDADLSPRDIISTAANGILFNHESPRRGETFVTRKTTRAVAAILADREEFALLG